MDIREVLALDISSNSAKKIDKYLKEIGAKHRDYPRALAYLSYITFSLGNITDAFSLLFGYLDKCPHNEKTVIYDTLIKIYYEQKDYKNVLNTIEIKKDFLPSYHKNGYYEDLITYYQKINDNKELIRVLLIYLADDISDERRLKALVILVDALIDAENYQLFYEKNKLVEALSLKLKDESIYLNSKYKLALVLYLENKYEDSLNVLDELLEVKVNKVLKTEILTLKLRDLIALKEYRKASIFESEYEQEIENASISTKITFTKACLDLYKELNNRYNYNIYLDKLVLLEAEKEELNNVDVKKKKKTNKKISFTFLEEEPNEIVFNHNLVQQEKPLETFEKEEKKVIIRENVNSVEIAIDLEKLANLLEETALSKFPSFREYLRVFLSKLQQFTYFDEAYLLVKKDKYVGYHYKVERLYDKKNLNLENTLLLDAYHNNKEHIYLDSKEISFVEINSNKLYKDLDKLSLVSFPLENGSILFTSKKDDMITKKLNYEKLKFSSMFLNNILNKELNSENLKEEYENYIHMIENIVALYKFQKGYKVTLSKDLALLLHLDENISLDDFYLSFNKKDLIEYRSVINNLMDKKINNSKVKYHINNRLYEEELILVDDNILSIIKDITELEELQKSSYEMATYDPLTKAYNKSKLIDDLSFAVTLDKFSLLAINIRNFKRYNSIYGIDFGNQLLYATSKVLKNFNDEYIIYHLDSDRFVVLIKNQNDKRSMIKISNELGHYLNLELYKLNYRLDLSFDFGIYRYPVDSYTKDVNVIIDYLLSALSSAVKNSNHISIYQPEDYKKMFHETEISSYISEAIDQNQLAISYQQVVDVKNNNCDHYIANINLANFTVSKDEIYGILEKRDMIHIIERYIIHRVLFEIKEMYEKTHLYFNINVNLSYETIKDNNLTNYILEQLKFFNIPKSAFGIIYNDKVTSEVLLTLKGLNKNKIFIASSNIDLLKEVDLLYFYYNLGKEIKAKENALLLVLKDYCDKISCNFVLNNVNNQRVISGFCEAGISLYAGNMYANNLRMKDILKAFLE